MNYGMGVWREWNFRPHRLYFGEDSETWKRQCNPLPPLYFSMFYALGYKVELLAILTEQMHTPVFLPRI